MGWSMAKPIATNTAITSRPTPPTIRPTLGSTLRVMEYAARSCLSRPCRPSFGALAMTGKDTWLSGGVCTAGQRGLAARASGAPRLLLGVQRMVHGDQRLGAGPGAQPIGGDRGSG